MKRFFQGLFAAVVLLAGVAPAYAAIPPIPPGPPQKPNTTQVTARRILSGAARVMTPINTVMATPPTYTEGTAGANSTIITTATTSVGGGTYNTSDASRFKFWGKFEASQSGTTGITDRSTTRLTASSQGYRQGSHGAGWYFYMDCDQFDVAAAWGNVPFAVYVTDLRTGIRARTTANDIVPTVTSTSYKKWVFSDTAPRIIEFRPLYSSSASLPVFRGVNVPATCGIWPITFAEEARAAYVGDSWGATGGTLNTNAAALLAPDFIGERLGLHTVLSMSLGGTGVLNDNAGNGTFGQRAVTGAASGDGIGDLDQRTVGKMDIVFLPNSLNDKVANNAAYTDAAAAAAYQSLVASVAALQPDAIIVGFGPEITRSSDSTQLPQSRFDALKTAFQTGCPQTRCVYLDNSLTGDAPLFGSSTTGTISTWISAGDGNHLNDTGNPGWGRRIGQMTINALQAIAGP